LRHFLALEEMRCHRQFWVVRRPSLGIRQVGVSEWILCGGRWQTQPSIGRAAPSSDNRPIPVVAVPMALLKQMQLALVRELQGVVGDGS
jgi:hypothetical protein